MMSSNRLEAEDEVTVSDPQNYGEGRGKFTAYLVESTSLRSEVRRRYSDFQWLHGRFAVERPGAIIPIIPHKQAMRESVRFSEQLLAERTVVLQTFLRNVVNHPELKDAPSLKTFLTAYTEEWEQVRDSAAAGEGVGGTMAGTGSDHGDGATGFLGKVRAKLAVAGVAELEQTPDDGAMEIMEEYLTHLDTQVKVWARESTALVKQGRDSAKSLQAMGAAFATLGKKPYPQAYSDETGELSSEVATYISDISIVVLKQSDQATIKLDDPMQDLARDVQAAKAALVRRKEIVWEYTRKTHAAKNQKVLLEKGRTSEPEVALAQQEAKAALKEVEVVSKRVRREMERFRDVFYEKLKATMKGYIKLQMEYHEHMDRKWSEMMPVVTDDGDDMAAGAAATTAAPGAPPPASAPPPPPPSTPVVTTENGDAKDGGGAESIVQPDDLLL